MKAYSRCVAVAVAALVIPLVVSGAPASASIRHSFLGSFNGSDAPSGPFPLVLSSAADASAGASGGDVYVGLATFSESTIEKFSATGEYASVSITGAETPQGSFSLLSLSTFLTSGIAVDSSTSANAGDVYVADVANGVVDKFNEAGHYVCQITSATTSSPSECNGAADSGLTGSIEPTGIAVDKTNGDLYVADAANAAIDRFDAAGNYLEQITDSHIVQPGRLALDSLGNMYLVNGAGIFGASGSTMIKFHNGVFAGVLDTNTPRTVAVDPGTNRVYSFDEGEPEAQLVEYDSNGALLSTFGAAQHISHGESLAVGRSGEIYQGEWNLSPEGAVNIFGADVVVPTVTTGPATGVQQTSATLTGHVDPDEANGGTEISGCEFEYGTTSSYGLTVPCAPPAPYASGRDVTATVSVARSTTYHFRLRATNANGANEGADETLTTFGPPAIDSQSATVNAPSATVYANINPFGYTTSCVMQYVDEARFSSSGYTDATTVPCSPGSLAAGFGDDTVSATVTGLSVGATYDYRFIARNSAGEAVGASQTLAAFGIKSFAAEVLDPEGQPFTQAGAHPYSLLVNFELNATGNNEGTLADGNLKDAETDLPPGLIGVPTATPRCTKALFQREECAGSTQVGILRVSSSAGDQFESPIYNLVPPPNLPAQFGSRIERIVNIYIEANVRTGKDYGVVARVKNASTAAGVIGATAELWGVPAESSHDTKRYCPSPGKEPVAGCASTAPPIPFLTTPTACAAGSATLSVDSWQNPGVFVTATSAPLTFTGCDRLSFRPSIAIAPDATSSDSPTGLSVDLQVPQAESQSPAGLAAPSLRNAVVTLPSGMTLNPAAANGLQACSPAQIALYDASKPTCPNASKVGSVEVITPLLTDKVVGSVYLAEQNNNPFGSTFAIYVVAEVDGALVKVAGEVDADPLTGQLTTHFADLPQLPFSDLRLRFFGGSRAPLTTPASCGTYEASSTLTPWSAPESGPSVVLSARFPISSGPGQTPCAPPLFSPGLIAGTTNNRAAAFSPFTLTLSRNDGEQKLGSVSTKLPPGLVAALTKVPLCSEGDANVGTCPPASAIGHVTATVGSGPDPLTVPTPDKPVDPVYLTGPYKGAPFGLSVVVPAEAGPFNLDENGRPVVVRAAIHIDPSTAQATVTSDPLPQILQGVPLEIRSVSVVIDRPEFMINPTSCNRMSLIGNVTSANGAQTTLTAPFQVADCSALAFRPSLTVKASGKTSKANGAGLSVKLTYPNAPQGTQANISRVKVILPKQLPSRLTTLQQACLVKVFDSNPADCPAGSAVGHAKAISTIVPVPLVGPAYFVSHGGEAFPSLVVVLQGYGITLDLVGSTFISKGITSSTFKTVPDAPIKSFELTLPQGRFSALAAYGDLCAASNAGKAVAKHKRGAVRKGTLRSAPLMMPTEFVAQNGVVIHENKSIVVTGCSKALGGKRRGGARHAK